MSKNDYRVSLTTLAIVTLYGAPAFAQDAPPADRAASPPSVSGSPSVGTATPNSKKRKPKAARKAKPASGDANVGEDIEITGSRLKNGDITSRTTVITREEIIARGVTSVEELIRTLPQNVATIGTITNERTNGPLASREKGSVSQLGSLGVSAANLGGLGAGNTLVLVNGRRIAGAAGIEDGFANLNGIPFSAIERVEINTNGASATYGADAVGGVINFILRRDFVGTTIGIEHERSSADADDTRVNLFSGYSWGSGSVTGTLSYDRREPINNFKTGYTTQNYASRFGGNLAYDLRSFDRGLQPGVIDRPRRDLDPDTGNIIVTPRGLTVPAGTIGRPAIGDFVEVGRESLPDFVPELAGPSVRSISATINAEQRVTDRMNVFFNGLYNRSTNSQSLSYAWARGLKLQLAPGQAYNPFPAYYFDSFNPGTEVNYYPAAELAAGTLPTGTNSNTITTWNISTGINYRFGRDTKIEFTYTTSASRASGIERGFGSLVQIIADPNDPMQAMCYNFELAQGKVTEARTAALQAAFNRQCRALTSADPAVAFNPWNASGKPGSGDVNAFYYELQAERRASTQSNYELRVNGTLLKLPAGKVMYAAGAEYTKDGTDSREVRNFTGDPVDRGRYAVFSELTIPILAGDFSVPLVRALDVTLAARRDVYKTSGPIGTVDNVPFERGGKIIYADNTFARTTPAIGVHWAPNAYLALRGRWTRGFRAPPYTQLFSVNGSSSFLTRILGDPLYTCTTDCDADDPGVYSVLQTTAPNPDLKPQTSTQQSYSASWTPTGFLRGLSLAVTYNQTQIRNEYATQRDLNIFLPVEAQLKLAEFYPRDANGKITMSRNLTFNLAGSDYSSLTYEASYPIYTKIGSFEPRVTMVRNLVANRRLFAGDQPISFLGKLQGPDRYRIVGSVGWNYKKFDVTLWGYYFPSYINDYIVTQYAGRVTNPDAAAHVDSLTTFDLTGSWRPTAKWRVNFAGRNILKARPPFVIVDGRPYDTARYNPAGRTLQIEAQYSF